MDNMFSSSGYVYPRILETISIRIESS